MKKKNIKKQQKIQTEKQVNLQDSKQLYERGTKDWLLAKVPKNVKCSSQIELENYAPLMENLKKLTLKELKLLLAKNNLKHGGIKADLIKKIYFGILDGVPQCSMCGERNLKQLILRNVYYCGECNKRVYKSHNIEWIF